MATCGISLARATRHLWLVVSAAAILTACATATPYQPVKNGYGYQDQQLENNRYRVSFRGNSETPRATVEDYLLYRAARITLENHYDYFVIDHQKTERSTHYLSTHEGFGGFGFYPFFYDPYFYSPSLATTTTTYPVDHYNAFATIVLHRGKKPSDQVQAYNARGVIKHIGPRVQKNPSEHEEQ